MTLLAIVSNADLRGDVCFGKIVSTSGLVVASVGRRADGALSAPTSYARPSAWRFAHEGRIDDVDLIRGRISPSRAMQIETYDESAALFSFLLTCIDAVGTTEAGLLRAIGDIRNSGARGQFNFLLSDGATVYAYRASPLFWLVRPNAVLVASETLTDEPWRALAESTLLSVDQGSLSWRLVTTDLDRSGPELPFTD
jgi:predicted glutamine amidotransferase